MCREGCRSVCKIVCVCAWLYYDRLICMIGHTHTHTHTHIYIYIYIYDLPTNSLLVTFWTILSSFGSTHLKDFNHSSQTNSSICKQLNNYSFLFYSLMCTSRCYLSGWEWAIEQWQWRYSTYLQDWIFIIRCR